MNTKEKNLLEVCQNFLKENHIAWKKIKEDQFILSIHDPETKTTHPLRFSHIHTNAAANLLTHHQVILESVHNPEVTLSICAYLLLGPYNILCLESGAPVFLENFAEAKTLLEEQPELLKNLPTYQDLKHYTLRSHEQSEEEIQHLLSQALKEKEKDQEGEEWKEENHD